MYCVRKVTDDLYWVGGNDRRLALFENIHPIPKGISYNAYLLLDEKTVLFDTADWSVTRQYLENVIHVLDGRPLDYLIINHMEPDHAAALNEIILRYPDVKIIATKKATLFMHQFSFSVDDHVEVVKEGDTKNFGRHTVTFIAAPMVHWPEVMVTFDLTDGILFSADAFGSFMALDGKLFNDEVNYDRDWLDEFRRYYANIVGKYGFNVQKLLGKAAALDIKMICPLHGLVWRGDLDYILNKYDKWSSYTPEKEGVVVVYASMYGNTECAADIIAQKLVERGITDVVMYDVSVTNKSYLISDVFQYSHLVLASATYNLGIFPPMHDFLSDMKALNVQKRAVGIIENGSWACKSGTLMTELLGEMKQMTVLDPSVHLLSSLKDQDLADMDRLADTIADDIRGH